ncbi:MAG TPA: peptide chain release factor N(5)-glutamine methyltransferase [Acidimicrobiales bacterium]
MSGRTWRELLALAEERLGDRMEARRLVERASGNEGAEYLLGLEERATERTEPFFLDLVERRAAGEPLQYVLGRWGFRRLDLFVDRRVLIPRPETEMVVQLALAELDAMKRASPPVTRPTVVDLGTGSGAIALSIAQEAPSAQVWATDRSSAAIEVARANLAGLGNAAARVRLLEGSWFEPLPATMRGRVDLVVSNPPYIADGEDLPADVEEWEPREALRAGPTGLEDIRTILGEARSWLARHGAAVVEIAPHQSSDAVALATQTGYSGADVRLDLAGRERVLLARW